MMEDTFVPLCVILFCIRIFVVHGLYHFTLLALVNLLQIFDLNSLDHSPPLIFS